MILQAAPRHEFIHQKPLVILKAVTDQFHQIRMIKLPQVVDFCLQLKRIHKINQL